MIQTLHQELYKLFHRRLSWFIIVILLAFMTFIGVAMRHAYSKLLVMTCFDSSDAIMLILVIVGSTIFSTEFQDKTILTLLYRSKSRAAVFGAKFAALVIYDAFLHLLAILITLLFNYLMLLHPVSLTAVYQYQQPLWVNMLATTGVDMITSGLIISLICLTSCLINSNTWVILVNAVIIFMGSDFSASLTNANVGPAHIIRWNPMNMLNLTTQYYNYASYHPTSMLTNNQLLLATLAYIALFIFCGYWAFTKKRL